ncbi:MAG: GSCFA domain-containing protein [Cypionkella sp.]|nr:GSCFA domain-containing protein [Cypionkella sp.]
MNHPYTNLPADRFWRTGVADLDPLKIAGLWQPKFPIGPEAKISTAGSCFAQHFSRALVARGYGWCDFEMSPPGLSAQLAHDFNYGVFSFRTGNIYTPKMLRQWLEWAFGDVDVPQECWEMEGRFYDPFRPAIEPRGFASAAEVALSRQTTLAAIRNAVQHSDVFVFTMGLTESWANVENGVEYAVCPGTIAGQFDAAAHVFVNHAYGALLDDLNAAMAILRSENSSLQVLLTVSPVPLTATASGAHVLTATSLSKSILRAVAHAACEGRVDVDYFPSYEIITSPAYRGRFFAPNLRQVLPEGVDHVMASFFADQAAQFGAAKPAPTKPAPANPAPANPAPAKPAFAAPPEQSDAEAEELACEEAILNAFAPSHETKVP